MNGSNVRGSLVPFGDVLPLFKSGLAKTRVLLKKPNPRGFFLGFMGFFGFYWAFWSFIKFFNILCHVS